MKFNKILLLATIILLPVLLQAQEVSQELTEEQKQAEAIPEQLIIDNGAYCHIKGDISENPKK